MGASADTVPRHSENIVFRKIENETILVPIRNNIGDLSNIYVLNDMAARIWELIDGKRSTKGISDSVCSEYEVSPEEAQKDIDGLLEELVSIGAIDVMSLKG